MNKDVIESLVSNVIQSYKFVGFKSDTIHERDLFLSLLTCALVKTDSSEGFTSLSSLMDTKKDFSKTVKTLANNKNFTPALREFFIDLSDLYEKNDGDIVIEEVFQFANKQQVSKLSNEELICIYDRVLQRLQAMNMPDHLASDFSYQSLPFNFAELYTELLQPKQSSRVYDPYAMTGESIVDFSLLNRGLNVTTESVNQSSRYIQHKLLIAGASEIRAKNSFALAPEANVKQAEFDFAFTLLQPSISSEIEDITADNSKKLRGNFEKARIPNAVIKSRFWEHALIHHILYALNDSGKAIIITGKGPLSRHSDFHSRKILVESNLIDGVIKLPSKLLDARTVSLFAIILNKKRSKTDKVKFIDVKDCYIPENGINKLANIDEIANTFHSKASSSVYVESVVPSSIIENGYSLNVENYLSNEVQQYEHINVEEVQQALSKQQRITDLIIKKLSANLST